MERSEARGVDVGTTAAKNLAEGRRLHVPDHHFDARGALHDGQDIKPIIGRGIDQVVRRDLVQSSERSAITVEVIVE